jgi:Ankyrin repeats (many copies)
VGATPLMLAARAGNLPLVQALLAKGADPELRDEFGHTAWLHAVSRAMEESAFALTGLPALYDALAPAVLDVQTDGRLVRIEHHQGEYWVLTLMLAGLKTQWSSCVLRSHEVWKYGEGFFAEQLHAVLERLPPHLWSDQRRKRSCVDQVLARSEVASGYSPARQLVARARHGHYLLNPAMLLRQGEGWVAVYDAFGLEWLDAGCGSEASFQRTPAEAVAQLSLDKTTAERAKPQAGSV